MLTVPHLLEFLKLAPRYLAAIGLFCGVLLIFPEGLAKLLGVFNLAQNYRQWLGAGFIASFCLLAMYGCVKLRDVIAKRMLQCESHERKLKRLHSLTEAEKQILRFYIREKTQTNNLRAFDGVVIGLTEAGILMPMVWSPNQFQDVPHKLCDFSWDYLNEHNWLLNGTTDIARTDRDPWE